MTEIGEVNERPASIHDMIERARPDFGEIKKDKSNPHFKSEYASLDAIMSAVRRPLAEVGVSVSHRVVRRTDEGWVLQTRITRRGEVLDSYFPLPSDTSNPQKLGSAITYGRRYNVSALLDLLTDEDDDGNASQPKKDEAPHPFHWLVETLGATVGSPEERDAVLLSIFETNDLVEIFSMGEDTIAKRMKHPETGWGPSLAMLTKRPPETKGSEGGAEIFDALWDQARSQFPEFKYAHAWEHPYRHVWKDLFGLDRWKAQKAGDVAVLSLSRDEVGAAIKHGDDGYSRLEKVCALVKAHTRRPDDVAPKNWPTDEAWEKHSEVV